MSSKVNFVPSTEQVDEEVVLELFVEDLRKEVQVRNEGSLEDNWNV